MVEVAEKPATGKKLEELLNRCNNIFSKLSQPITLATIDQDEELKFTIIQSLEVIIRQFSALEDKHPEIKELGKIRNKTAAGLAALERHDAGAVKMFMQARALVLELQESLLQPTR